MQISVNDSYLLQYISLIKQGKINACEKLKRWLEILERDMKNSQWIYSLEKGHKIINYIEKYCRHSKGEWSGKPLLLHISQKAYFEAKYAFLNAKTGHRRFKESLMIVAKKNGKSTIASAESLYLSSGDGEMGAEVYLAANSLDETDAIFIEAYRMTLQNPLFNGHKNNRKGLYHKTQGKKMECRKYFSFIQALAVNPGALDGKNVYAVEQDEIHESSREMYEILSPGVSARDNNMYSMYTTAGTKRAELYDDMYEYAEGVLNGTIDDDGFFPWIYEQDDESEISNPDMWDKSNPLIGIIKKISYMERTVKKMKGDPKSYNKHATKDFNIPKNGSNALMCLQDYENKEHFDIKELEGCYAIIGVDLSHIRDLTSVVAMVYKPSTDKVYVLHKSFMPGDDIEKRTEDEKLPYTSWEKKGFIDGSGTNIILHSDVTKWILRLKQKYKIYPYYTGYDRALSSYWVEEMKNLVYPRNWSDQLIRIAQGPMTFHHPMKQLVADLQKRKVIYNDDQVLKWAFGNVESKTDNGGNEGPDKSKAKKKRIDPFMALLNVYAIFCGENRGRYLSLQEEK